MKVVEDEEMLQYLKEVGEYVNDKTTLFAMQTFARYLHGDFTSNVRKDVDKQLFPMESRAKFQEFHKTYIAESSDSHSYQQSFLAREVGAAEPVSRSWQVSRDARQEGGVRDARQLWPEDAAAQDDGQAAAGRRF